MDLPICPPTFSISTQSQPFRFFDLPSELRVRIYESILVVPHTVDLDPSNPRQIAPRLNLFLTCHRIHDEAYRVFYGSNIFRLFPVHYRFFHTKWPLLARLPPRYRAAITMVELRLGPGWTAPPKCWNANARLGLSDVISLRVMNVFVECDPASHAVFAGFRKSDDFYTHFCCGLVRQVFGQVPTIQQVQFDAYPSVKKEMPLMDALITETKAWGKSITWGPLRGWGRDDCVVDIEVLDEKMAMLYLGTA